MGDRDRDPKLRETRIVFVDLLTHQLKDEYLEVLRVQGNLNRDRQFYYIPEVSDRKYRYSSTIYGGIRSEVQVKPFR